MEEGGFLYDSNVYNDDLPITLRRGEQQYILLPYAFDTNDMHFFKMSRFVRGEDFSGYCGDAFTWLAQEGGVTPKLMTVGLHTRIIGRPGRIGGLFSLLQRMTKSGDASFARREEIARTWPDQGL